MKVLFLAWAKDHARTRLLGKALGAQLVFIHRLGRARGASLILKYLLQAIDTVRLLARERPEVILVQTPPVFVALLAALYAMIFRGTRVIIDAHSGTFLSPKWAWSLPLQRWCSRRAQLTVVHMPSLMPTVEAWGAAAIELAYVFEEGEPPAGEHFPLPAGINVAVPSSFNADEPVDLVFDAARHLPDVRFYMTGDPARLPQEQRAGKPDNVILTGYLSVPEYFGLLRGATAILALTTQDQTFQTGGAEAVWLERPLLISDWPELRRVFARGAVFVEHTPEGLAEGIRAVEENRSQLQAEMRQLRYEFNRELQAKLRRLQAVVANGRATRQVPGGEWVADKEY